MRSTHLIRGTIIGLLIAVSWPAQRASGQEAESAGGLFGGGSPQAGQSLDLNWSLISAKDANAQSGQSSDPRVQIQGIHGLLGTNLQYVSRRKHSSLTISAGSEGRYYPDLHQLNAFDGHAGVSFTTALGPKLTLRATQALSYQPYYQFSFLSSPVTLQGASGSPGDSAVTSNDSYHSEGRLELERRMGRRSTLAVGSGFQRTTFSDDEQFASYQADAQFSRGLTRNASLKLGYGYTQALNTFGVSGPRQSNHTINIGMDYRRALAFSRRTSVGFSSGSTMTSPNGRREMHVIGEANITREIGRTWKAVGKYGRAVQFMAGFSEPVIADTIQAQVGGFVGHRISVGVAGSYSAGVVGTGQGAGYSNASGNATVRTAITRALAVEIQYIVYRHAFDQTVGLPLGVPSSLNRQGFRFGLAGRLPLFR